MFSFVFWLLQPYFILSLLLSYVVFLCVRAVYRITLHPLAKFPGPKFVAISTWYEFYYEVIKPGRFSKKIDLMHEKYGPIVRVTPNQIHISDPEFYDNLYNFDHNINRPVTQFNNLQNSPDFQLHKIRRRALDPYFSKPAVLKLEDVIQSNVESLCERFQDARGGSPLNFSLFARCLTSEIIYEYTFADTFGFWQNPQRSEAFFGAQSNIFQCIYLWREYYITNRFFMLMNIIPPWMLPSNHLATQMAPLVKSCIDRLQVAMRGPDKKNENTSGHRIIFDEWQSADIPPGDKLLPAQLDTSLLLVTAGFETTAYTLETGFFHLLSNPELAKTLKEEIANAFPTGNQFSWTELERLPYLTAVIQESLRMSCGVLSRLPRINTQKDLVYKDWVIPKDTPIGMSIPDIHFNPEIYPDPLKFDPGRWLRVEESKHLEKYLCSFSKGARRCLGMNLAWAELYITFATIFHRFDMQLFETTREDIDPHYDYFIPVPKGTNKVRLLIK